jgi:hypothetical protein
MAEKEEFRDVQRYESSRDLGDGCVEYQLIESVRAGGKVDRRVLATKIVPINAPQHTKRGSDSK